MDIRSSLDGLKTLLGVTPAATTPAQRPKPAAEENSLNNDRATLSSAGSEVAQSSLNEGVRTEKVLEIQNALQAGTYNVPPAAVAAKMVDAMLERGK